MLKVLNSCIVTHLGLSLNYLREQKFRKSFENYLNAVEVNPFDQKNMLSFSLFSNVITHPSLSSIIKQKHF